VAVADPIASPRAVASPTEREAAGKKLRGQVPRGSHRGWEPPPDRRDPVAVLSEQAETRVPELVPIRHGRMSASPFAFYRGAAAIMAADLAGTPQSGLTVQLCGDAHLSNFGGYAAPDREMVFDVNDFDETLPGPWEWDVKRLAASLAVAGRDLNFSRKERDDVVLAAVGDYGQTMRRLAGMRNLDVWYLRTDTSSLMESYRDELDKAERRRLRKGMAKARSKDSLRALSKLTHRVDGELRIISDPPLIVPMDELIADAGADVEVAESDLAGIVETYRSSLSPSHRHLMDGYRYIHSARKVVGVGSVGTQAFIALFVGRDEGDPLFLQIKEAQASVLEPYTEPSAIEHQGQRVVRGQHMIQAASDIFLGWLTGSREDGSPRHFYVRQLWDQKASARIEQMTAPQMAIYGRICGATLARAHARSGDRIAIGAYLGKGSSFDEALADFAEAYAKQNQRDFEAMTAAIADGHLESEAEPG
jgi:uncharacterized protein (DUF2252 family)